MSGLETPPPPALKDRLRDPADEATLQRMWLAIGARASRARRPRAWPAVAAMGAVAAGAAAVALIVYAQRDHGPLHLADGQPVAALTAPAEGRTLALADGSSIRLEAGARLEPLESSGSMFLAILQRGSAAFDVRPGGPRRWQIECGLATVEVVGTRFSCERRPGALRVAVQRGVVLVRGERVADRVRRLAAGEELEIVEGGSAGAGAETGKAETATETGAGADTNTVATTTRSTTTSTSTTASTSTPSTLNSAEEGKWREMAREGRNREAFAALGVQGVRREVARVGVADLLALADVARLSGHPADAVAPLGRILTAFARDPQAPLAAFALARLELDELGRPREAAAALEKAIALGVPHSLREDVRARLVEAYGRAGDRPAARRAAETYAREFPGGRYAPTVEPWLAGDR